MRLTTLLILLAAPLNAQSEIDTEKIAELLYLPGLSLEIEDHTERESKVRNIHFKKVAYVKVTGEDHIYPMVIWIASKGAIEADKYGKLRKHHEEADSQRKERLKKLAAAYFPETDNAVASLDQIKMTKYFKSAAIEGDPWEEITPMVGGVSITATNEELGLDYQILLTGAEEQDPELAAKYRSEPFTTPYEKYREGIRDIITLVRDSPLMATAASQVTQRDVRRREDRREIRPIRSLNATDSEADASSPNKPNDTANSSPYWWIAITAVAVAMFLGIWRILNRRRNR